MQDPLEQSLDFTGEDVSLTPDSLEMTQSSALLTQLSKEVAETRDSLFELSKEHIFGLDEILVSDSVVLVYNILQQDPSEVKDNKA